jgi:hypothetical protein
MLDELLKMSLNEDVVERILGLLEQRQHRETEIHRESGSINHQVLSGGPK